MSPLSLFHPLIAQWFTARMGAPTDVQAEAWPLIAGGAHVLLIAPTGSGKTLSAFLWAINQLITGAWGRDHTRVVYVSPLRALNNDIQRNLLTPLRELERLFVDAGEALPEIRVLTRSGDTGPAERDRMLRRPPEILITTPESLNLLLTTPRGRQALTGIRSVILDEIHAVVGTKRGTHLITGVDRLVPACGEFQRIALSATVRPEEAVARFVGGYRMTGSAAVPVYVPRAVAVVKPSLAKRYDIRVRAIPETADGDRAAFWDRVADELRPHVCRNRSTLVFTNSRRLCERVTLGINRAGDPIAYAHHGSLSREIRHEVEQRLKAGELRAIVATNSLELGIDIGALDEVVLLQSPPSIASAVQRVGRAGHQVGAVSRGALYPTHDQDLVAAAALVPAMTSQDIEQSAPVMAPLDVLSQVIVSMVATEEWDVEELFARLRTSCPFNQLPRAHFDLVLDMLDGRYADSRIRELRPLVSVDRAANIVSARRGALLALYGSGGTIPDRGYFHLRHQSTNGLIGELDEEFVWEAKIGQAFTLGTQSWRIERITHNDVFVLPGTSGTPATPFWRAEAGARAFHFAEKAGLFLESVADRLSDPSLAAAIAAACGFDQESAARLVDFLRAQRDATGCLVPHRHHLVVEHVASGPGGAPGNQIVLHTPWGLRVNRPLSLALEAAWDARFGDRLQVYPSDDAVVLVLPRDASGRECLDLVTEATVDSLVRAKLEGSGFFAARFRECAGRALLLSRSRIGERMPLWMNRLRSQKLLRAAARHDDFPIMLETWRTCIQDEFDMASLHTLLTELERGLIRVSEVHTLHPSPFARGSAWRHINEYMYMGDFTPGELTSGLRDDLIRSVAFTPHLRPAIPHDVVSQFVEKRQRTYPGYTPATPRELLDWLKERQFIPGVEWERLLAGIHRDHGLDAVTILGPLGDRILTLPATGEAGSVVVARERASTVLRALRSGERRSPPDEMPPRDDAETMEPDPTDGREAVGILLAEWLQFYGPVSERFIVQASGIAPEMLASALEAIPDAIIRGNLIEASGEIEVCDAANFETLLRIRRRHAAPSLAPRPLHALPSFLACLQNLAVAGGGPRALHLCLEQLSCYSAAAGAWETEVLPARLPSYVPSWMDALMNEGEIMWIGSGDQRVCFVAGGDLDLLPRRRDREPGRPTDAGHEAEEGAAMEAWDPTRVFPDPRGRYDFGVLLERSGGTAQELADRLWDGVWKGTISNDGFGALRKGIENQFRVPGMTLPPPSAGRRRFGRTSFSRWKGSLPMAGTWFRMPEPEATEDPIEAEERTKARARCVLERYGIIFRGLLANEPPSFRWPALFRALRLMELSGEIVGGYFFEGIPGLQFASHQGLRLLHDERVADTVYWISATDPASLCGVRLPGLKGLLPRRVPGNHLVYHGERLVVASERWGGSLTFCVPPDHPDAIRYLGFLEHLLTRPVQPLRRVTVARINGRDAAGSPYLDVLRARFDAVAEHRHVAIHRRY